MEIGKLDSKSRDLRIIELLSLNEPDIFPVASITRNEILVELTINTAINIVIKVYLVRKRSKHQEHILDQNNPNHFNFVDV